MIVGAFACLLGCSYGWLCVCVYWCVYVCEHLLVRVLACLVVCLSTRVCLFRL